MPAWETLQALIPGTSVAPSVDNDRLDGIGTNNSPEARETQPNKLVDAWKKEPSGEASRSIDIGVKAPIMPRSIDIGVKAPILPIPEVCTPLDADAMILTSMI